MSIRFLSLLGALACAGTSQDDGPTDSSETGRAKGPNETGDTATETVEPPVPATGDWTWANPLPQGSPIDEIRFVNDTTAFALTDGGGVLRTTNAGETWVTLYGVQALGYGGHVAMSFVDAQSGWLVGPQGRILQTGDSGETWTDQSLPSFPYNLHDVYFTNPQHGVVVGATGRLLTTDDGGKTWDERTHPGGSTFLNAVAFVDDLHGWVVGDDGLVLETADGGKKWTLLNNTLSDDIELAVPAGNGVAVATRTEVHVWDGVGWSQEVTADGGVLDVQMQAEGDGFVLYGHQGELRFGTLTAGQLAFETLVLNPSPRTFARRGDRMLVGGMWGALFVSSDAGQTFQEAWSRILTYDVTQLLDVSMAGMRGISAGMNGIALWTDDGGVTWTEADTGITTDFRAVWLEEDGNAIAGGYDTNRVPTIVWSDDHGETWSQASLPALGKAFINGVALWDDGRGIAVGWIPGTPLTELILLSNDGGKSWTQATAPGETAGFVEVWAHGTEDAWIGAGFGDLVRTTDGGQNFVTIDSGTNRAFHEVQFVDESTGWAATMSQDVLHTTDGGLTWTPIVVPSTSFDDLHFGSSQVGIAVAGSGTVYGTVDGGKTWARHANQWSGFGHVRAISMTSETDAVIVGTELKIAYTRNAGGMVEP